MGGGSYKDQLLFFCFLFFFLKSGYIIVLFKGRLKFFMVPSLGMDFLASYNE